MICPSRTRSSITWTVGEATKPLKQIGGPPKAVKLLQINEPKTLRFKCKRWCEASVTDSRGKFRSCFRDTVDLRPSPPISKEPQIGLTPPLLLNLFNACGRKKLLLIRPCVWVPPPVLERLVQDVQRREDDPAGIKCYDNGANGLNKQQATLSNVLSSSVIGCPRIRRRGKNHQRTSYRQAAMGWVRHLHCHRSTACELCHVVSEHAK